MTDNVVGIFGDPVAATGRPDPALISLLEDALRRAKDGELQHFIGTGFLNTGLRYSIWARDHETDVFQMMGSLAWLQHEYYERVKEEHDDA